MPQRLKFGSAEHIALLKSFAIARGPVSIMRARYGNKFSDTCQTCRFLVTRMRYGVKRWECAKYTELRTAPATWKPNTVACGVHEPRPEGIPS